METLSNELITFMMRIEDGRFAHHIMNIIGMSMIWMVCEMLADWLLDRRKCKCQLIGNQENKINVHIRNEDKKLFRMWNVNLKCALPFNTHSG
jgi:hypothetical protein